MLILRSEKGNPLTIAEEDGNFSYLLSLFQSVNVNGLLPLTAGIGKPLSGPLYLGGNSISNVSSINDAAAQSLSISGRFGADSAGNRVFAWDTRANGFGFTSNNLFGYLKTTNLTAARDFNFPDKNITVAGIDDIATAIASVVKYDGTFPSLAALQAAFPTSSPGHTAVVDGGAGVAGKEYLWDSQDGWVPSGSGAGLTSFNGRTTPAVVPQTGDYTTAQVVTTGSITNAMLSGGIDLTSKVSGLLPDANIASATTWNAKATLADVKRISRRNALIFG